MPSHRWPLSRPRFSRQKFAVRWEDVGVLTDRQCVEILRARGHNPLGVVSSAPEKHRFECSCGYRSVQRRTFQLALEAGIHHMRKEARLAVANGAQIPTKKAAVG